MPSSLGNKRTQQRLAESYLEVLRIVEREGQWVEAGIRSVTDKYPDGPNHDQVRRVRDELYPNERAARHALADAIAVAEELGHR